MIRVMTGIKAIGRAALVGCCCMVLAACDSSTSTIDPPAVIDDDQIPDQPIVSAVPVLSGARAELRFEVQEDFQLRGRFYTTATPPTNPVTIQSLPEHGVLTLESASGVFLYTPAENYWGGDGFRYITSEGLEVSVFVDVLSVNDTPTLSPELARVAEQGRLYAEQLVAADGDGDTLRFNAASLPPWLGLDAASGVLSGTPTQQDIGVSDGITVRVTDSTGLFDEVTDIRIEVIDINDKPTLNLTQVPDELRARESISARVFPDDADGDAVTLVVEPNAFVSGSADGGTITLIAQDVNDVTLVNVVIRATDRQGGVSREIVPLTIFPLTDSGKGLTVSGSKTGRGVHLVLLGDGYAEDQQNLFREHVESVLANMAADDGIAAHLGAFNIHMIGTVSADSGADDNEEVDSRDTAYDSTYNCRSVARLICANTLAMFEAALVEYPAVDQIILLVNDQRYGGSGNSGGSVAITSAYSPEIALHEMGHSLADLADEYVDPLILESTGLIPFEEGRYPNVTAATDPLDIPWQHWIEDMDAIPGAAGESGVGLFEGGLYRETGVFRPTFDSRMRSFDAPFGVVNSEQWVLRLYTLTEGIRGFTPIVETVRLDAGETQEFFVSPIFGDDIQSVEWEFNDEVITPASEDERLSLSPELGTHTLTMTVTDISGVIQQPPPHAGIFTWTWEIIVK